MRKLTLLASVAVSLLLAGCAKEQKDTFCDSRSIECRLAEGCFSIE